MTIFDEIQTQIMANKGHTYYGGKNGFDYCCLKDGKIICSGLKQDMLKIASVNKGYYVAIVIPVSFTNAKEGGEG